MALTPDETARYARHLVLKGMGGTGQQALKSASVLVVGAGGLGSPVIAYLAAAGVGTIGIVDNDTVSLSNLQRQIVHDTNTLGVPKTRSAHTSANRLNPHINTIEHNFRLDADNALALMQPYDLVLDGSDNFSTRIAVAQACVATQTILISGAVSMFDGQVTVFAPHLADQTGAHYPSFTDLYPETADDADLPSCEATGVLGPLTGVIGTLMAMEAIKLITGIGEPLFGRLLLYDGRAARFTELSYSAQ